MLKILSKSDVIYRHTLLFVLASVLIVGSAVVLWYTYQQTNKMNRHIAEVDAEQFATSVAQFRNFYSKAIVPAAKDHGMSITHDYKNKRGAIPLPATFVKDFGESISNDISTYTVRLYSDFPFPWRNQDKLSDVEKETLEKIKENPSKPIISIGTLNNTKILKYARGDVMKQNCIECHNSYQGTPKKDWKVGDVRGVLEVIRPLNSSEVDTIVMLKTSFLMMLVIILSMVGLIFFVLRKLTSSLDSTYEAYLKEEDTSKHLKASGIKMRAIVDSVDEVIIVINYDGIITECNQAINQVFGYSPEEVIGQNVSILMTKDHHTKHDKYIRTYLLKNKSAVMGQSREFFAIRKNGEEFPIELFVNDARVGDEIIFTGSIRDITHLKKSQEITEKAHQAALESAELKSEFLANMSHEIRTPMNGVIGMTEMLLLSELDEEQMELAHTVKDSADSLLTIINDILDFSKIEAGKLNIIKNNFPLLKMIESSIDLLSKEANRKQVEIAFFIDNDVPLEINGDAGRLRQVLINLFNNALKFTEHGHIILYVNLVDDSTLSFSIKDSGIGIPEAALTTLFDSFSQVDGSSSREHGGTGLGLAICKQLVNLMEGEIGVKSKVGRGSTFCFTIKIDTIKDQLITPYIDINMNVLMWSTSDTLNRYYKKQLKQWGMSSKVIKNLNHLNNELNKNDYEMLALDADNIFIDPEKPGSFFPILKTLRHKTNALFVLYASHQQYQKLIQLNFDNKTVLFKKPIKHTAIKDLLNSSLQAYEIKKKTKKHSLPMTKSRETIAPKVCTNDQNKKTLKSEKNKYHILVAEDNIVNQKVAIKMLTVLGCKTTVSANGKEALQQVNNTYFDAVFMDCQMPELDGYEATKLIRELPEDHHNYGIPIVAFTANAMKDDHEKCEQAGMDDYLSKPVDLEQLRVILNKWFEKMNARQAIHSNKNNKEDLT